MWPKLIIKSDFCNLTSYNNRIYLIVHAQGFRVFKYFLFNKKHWKREVKKRLQATHYRNYIIIRKHCSYKIAHD